MSGRIGLKLLIFQILQSEEVFNQWLLQTLISRFLSFFLGTSPFQLPLFYIWEAPAASFYKIQIYWYVSAFYTDGWSFVISYNTLSYDPQAYLLFLKVGHIVHFISIFSFWPVFFFDFFFNFSSLQWLVVSQILTLSLFGFLDWDGRIVNYISW